MAKEITLEELANSSKANITKTTENIENKTSKSDNIQSGKAISVQDLGTQLRKSHGIDEPGPKVVEDAPLVKNAFESMYKTIEERKRRIEEEFMPIVEENARDMAMQRELGIDIENTKLGDREEGVEVAPGQTSTVITDEIEENTSDIIDIELDEDDTTDIENEVEKQYVVHEEKPVTKSKPPKKKVVTKVVEEDTDDDLDSLMKDLEAEEEKLDIEDDDEDTAEEIRARFKESLQSVKIARDPIDLNKFKIRKTATSSASVLSSVNARNKQLKKADWALFYTGRSVSFMESRGPELDALRKTINNSNPINGVIASLRFVYDHIVDANKPSFESWCKLIRTEDIESLYFGLYRACYADANLVARACIGDNGCKKTSLIETDINTMVKFDSDEVKDKFYTILNKDTTTETKTFESELIQISDDFVISFSAPTLYSTFIQYATLKPEVADKYSDILNTMAYIDGFFNIDRSTQELIPLSVKEYPNNLNKTVLSKLKVYTEILKTLTNDQYNILTAKLNNVIQNSKVTYIYPETTCPECGSTIVEENIDSVLNLLFTRAQLVQIKSL